VPSSGENDGSGNWGNGFTENLFWFILLIVIIIILAILVISKDRFQRKKPTDEKGTPRIAGRGVIARATNQTTSEALIAGDSIVSDEVLGIDFSTMRPRVAIVKRYGILLDALEVLRKVPIQANMTAREIEGLLKKRGYPVDETAKLTTGFERAMYSAREIIPTDWERFSALADSIQNYVGDAV